MSNFGISSFRVMTEERANEEKRESCALLVC